MRIALFLAIAFLAAPPLQAENYVAHGISLYNKLKYGQDFTHFEYANPDAPKTGTFLIGWIGTFDSLNPFILKGVAARGVANLIYGGRFLEFDVLAHEAVHGNHIGILIVEIGVGMAVAAVMMIIFFSFARRR